MRTWKDKLLSRKFLIAVAAFLASIGASIGGLCTGSEVISTVGIICSILAAGIYAGCEAFVDASHTDDK